MKKILAILVSAVFCAGVVTGCGASGGASSSSAQAPSSKALEVSSESSSSASATDASSAAPAGDTVLPEKLVLGLDAAFPPMGFTNEDNEIVGADIDIAKAVCEKLGIGFEAKPISWDAKEMELNTDKITCIWNGFTMTEDNKAAFEWSRPYMDNTQVIVVANESTIASKADLAGKTVAAQKSSSGLKALQKDAIFANIAGGAAKEYEDYVTALTDLEIGRCDAVVMDSIFANYYINENKKNMKVLADGMGKEQYGIAFKAGNTQLKDAVEKALSELAAEGKIAEISNQWFGVDNMIITY